MDSQKEKHLKTVAIIGAGPSGLISAKEALNNGLIPTIFEKKSDLGGIWNRECPTTWNNLVTNVSKFVTSFEGTDWERDTKSGMFSSTQTMSDYLNGFAEKWNLRQYIEFQTTVLNITPLTPNSKLQSEEEAQKSLGELRGDRGWIVKWEKNNGTKKSYSKAFDGVIVATGILGEPSSPKDIKGLETFPGRVIHSTKYKVGSEFEGQRVLVVGGAFSGTEISADVCDQTTKTIHCFRNLFWILERNILHPLRNKVLPIDLVVFQNRNFYKQLPPGSESNLFQSTNEFFLSFCQEQQEFDDFKISPDAFKNPIDLVITDRYLSQVKNGKVLPRRQNILEVQGSKVKLESGEIHEVDCIILATGFTVGGGSMFTEDVLKTIGFDEADGNLPFILYKATLHPDISNLFFVGMYRNPLSPVAEQQARWACRLLSGKVTLPSRDIMMEGLVEEKRIRDQRPRPQLPHGDYFNLSDAIAKLNKSFPDLDKMESDEFTLAEALGRPLKSVEDLEKNKSEIYKMFMNQPVIPDHYNLVDNPEEALKQMQFLERVITGDE